MLTLVEPGGRHATVALEARHAPPPASNAEPAPAQAVVSWNTRSPRGTLELRVRLRDGRESVWLPYATFAPGARRSLNGADDIARLETDVLIAAGELAAIEVRADIGLDAVAVATPTPLIGQAAIRASTPSEVRFDVPLRTQYLADAPEERGWCSPASLSMLLAVHGIETSVREIAAAVYDDAYGGAGNWTFATAFASSFGLRAAVAYLHGIEHAQTLLAAGLPFAASIAWRDGELPGAPLVASAGHLVVVCGVSEHLVYVNDPARPEIAVAYDRDAFECVWLAHGGVAYLIAPAERSAELVALADR